MAHGRMAASDQTTMKRFLLIVLPLLILVGLAFWWFWRPYQSAPAYANIDPDAARSFREKLAKLSSPAPATPQVIEVSESELNSFLHYDISKLYPAGIKQVSVKLLPGGLQAAARVNFSELEFQGKNGNSGLLRLMLNGEHDIEINTAISCENGTGTYQVLSTRLDQSELPKPLVDLLIAKVLAPKLPSVKAGNHFVLPQGIQRIDLQEGKLIIHRAS